MPRTRSNYSVVGSVQTVTASSTRGVYTSEDQKIAKQNGVWPSSSDLIISPAVSGKTNWVWAVDGNLTITTPGEYTLTFVTSASKVTKMWGAGGAPNSGGSTSWGAGGGGGAATGTVQYNADTTYIIRVSQSGRNVAASAPALAYGAGNSGGVFTVGTAGSGGGYTGIFRTSVTQANAIMIAGGGGGGASDRSDGLGGRKGTAGGGTAGQTIADFQAAPGTQSAGGAAAGGSTPTSGSALQGGNGAGGGGGGGGGYFGGGGGGTQGDGGYGGAGGSGYYSTTYVTSATLYTGTDSTPGNSADALRPGTAGAGTTAGGTSSNGAVIIIA
jgi:hypothetical protein